jgi:uncharacterized RmlC-like cupin family protein
MFTFSLRIAGLVAVAGLAASGCSQEGGKDAEIIVIRPAETTGTKQGLPIFQGISGQNAGAKHISMNKGRVKTLYGEGLKKEVVNEAGDFLYIPADLPHKPINLSTTEAAEAIVARTDPDEQESVLHVAEPDAAAEGK